MVFLEDSMIESFELLLIKHVEDFAVIVKIIWKVSCGIYHGILGRTFKRCKEAFVGIAFESEKKYVICKHM